MATQEDLILQQYSGLKQQLAQKKKQAEGQLGEQIGRFGAITGLQGGSAIKAAGKQRQALEETFGSQEAALGSEQAAQMRAALAEKEAREFSAGEAEKQRVYGTSERVSGQEFAGSEAQKAQQFTKLMQELQQQFAAEEAGKTREYGTGERLAGQEFAAGETEKQREFAAIERIGTQEFQKSLQELQQLFSSTEAGKQREFATTEREAGQEFAASEKAVDRLQQERQFEEQLNFQRGSFAEQMQFQWSEFNENLKTNLVNTVIALKEAGIDKIDSAKGSVDVTKWLGNMVRAQQGMSVILEDYRAGRITLEQYNEQRDQLSQMMMGDITEEQGTPPETPPVTTPGTTPPPGVDVNVVYPQMTPYSVRRYDNYGGGSAKIVPDQKNKRILVDNYIFYPTDDAGVWRTPNGKTYSSGYLIQQPWLYSSQALA